MQSRDRQKRLLVFGGLLLLTVWFLVGWKNNTALRNAGTPSAQSDLTGPSFLEVGEELEYNVSYSFFNIGTIRLSIVGKEMRDGRPIYRTSAVIESNPSLSWLTEVHIRFRGEMDDSTASYYWVSEDSSKAGVNFHTLTFQYDDSILVYRKGQTSPSGERKVTELDTVRIRHKEEDGLALFYYARRNVRQKKDVAVPTFIDNQEKTTYIHFQNKIEDADIDAVDYPVETVFFDGKADFVGVVGLTGGFRGWFSNDDARIPIVARLSVWLGSIKVELKHWNRPGWAPPRYVAKD